MSDRCSATITLGGALDRDTFVEMAGLIADEGLSTDWDGPWFRARDLLQGQPLRLVACEVTGGQFDELEAWCVAHGVPFARWSGAYPGSWSAERAVFTGQGEPACFIADEDDRVLVDQATVEVLGTMTRLREHFAAAAFIVPPLTVSDWEDEV
jgi:hypothetical protein